VEDGAIIDVIEAHEVAHLLFSVDAPHALTHDKDTSETAIVFIWPLLPDLLARVEELGYSRA
jgi:hypothetical protein